MLDWKRGYAARWRLYEVDESTWSDGRRLPGLVSASIERDCTGDAPELESASMELDAPVEDSFTERVLRLAMIADQDGESERVDVCTMVFSATTGETAMGRRTHKLVGSSVLHSAATTDTWLSYGSYVPAGSDGAEVAGQMIALATKAPVEVVGGFTLNDHYVFDREEMVLESAWAILRAGGFHMAIDGRGRIRVEREPQTPALTLDREHMRLLLPSISHELDWSGVPNRYTAMDGSEVATVTNDDPLSVTSTATRGYVVDELDTSAVRIDGETLEAYAARRLEELSVAVDAREWQREWWPGVLPGSVVRATLRREGVAGDYRVKRQSLDCGAGIVVTERAESEVRLWPTT